ncbi:MAG: hypothetical protein UV74_C0013G0002 [Candidatus Woesebacteria bacterium GW2011_GWB1_43_14]|uniref:Uncharacterized protein n=1 Tax=Candidatus Woesebacteria bacterium GW2011_GWB1_43_14 TaxID=1618578 RepID=A0A0G1DG48_9BACT|nr:MAG: hypothetical protein UV51_C0009G0002 [Candidatus Woesebacteria bacterium GW2011_GWC1_42_9]KKS96880.1 MAG: hypothetical protein UV74_C0013G0002 [Candidatus Woesebacteria bacterium GW2011_GWB1_43_14]
MKQGYILALVVGLLLVAYLLEATVEPLILPLATPYHYLNSETIKTYPFTTTVIVIRAVALFLSPLLLMSYIARRYLAKSVVLLILSALTQLYVLQELATGSKLIPLEWSLAISLAGLALLAMIPLQIIRAGVSSTYSKIAKPTTKPEEKSPKEKEK